MRSRCSVCDRAPFADTTAYRAKLVPMCGQCRQGDREALLRPDIVWFGEALPTGVMDRIARFIMNAGPRLVFVAVGTSGLVYPAAGLVEVARRVGGSSWLINLEAADNASSFDHVVLGPAARELPVLFT